MSEEAEGRDKDLKFIDRRRRRENEGIDSGLISRSGNFLRACCRAILVMSVHAAGQRSWIDLG